MNIRKTYDSVLGAKLLLALANQKGYVLNVTKTQKLMYIIYGYFLANEDIIIFDEKPKAWPFGPVFPKTRKKIDFERIYTLDNNDLKDIKENSQLVEVMNAVIDKYAKYSAQTLSDWSHTEGSPWDKTTKKEDFNWNIPIDNQYIKEYFSDFNIL